ncbi:hypothetical protein NEFER03_0831 [Nematocida sp. LUAm3]|nr:hypothetical protein NEFER03_0831 [Nematocida sp. LUAm3]
MQKFSKRLQLSAIYSVIFGMFLAGTCEGMGINQSKDLNRVEMPKGPEQKRTSSGIQREVDPFSTFRSSQHSKNNSQSGSQESQRSSMDVESIFDDFDKDYHHSSAQNARPYNAAAFDQQSISSEDNESEFASEVKFRKVPPIPPIRNQSLKTSRGSIFYATECSPLKLDCLWSKIVKMAIKHQISPDSNPDLNILNIAPDTQINIASIFDALQKSSNLLNNAYHSMKLNSVLPKDKDGMLNRMVTYNQFIEREIYSLILGQSNIDISKKLVSKITMLFSFPYQDIDISRSLFADPNEFVNMLLVYSILCSKIYTPQSLENNEHNPPLLVDQKLPALFKDRALQWISLLTPQKKKELVLAFEAIFITTEQISTSAIWKEKNVVNRIINKRTELNKKTLVVGKDSLDIIRPLSGVFAPLHPLFFIIRQRGMKLIYYKHQTMEEEGYVVLYDCDKGPTDDDIELTMCLELCGTTKNITMYAPPKDSANMLTLAVKKRLLDYVPNPAIKITLVNSLNSKKSIHGSDGSIKMVKSRNKYVNRITTFFGYIFTVTLYTIMGLVLFLGNASFVSFVIPALILIFTLSMLYFERKKIAKTYIKPFRLAGLAVAVFILSYLFYRMVQTTQTSTDSQSVYVFVFSFGLVLVGLGVVFMWISSMMPKKNSRFSSIVRKIFVIFLLTSSVILAVLPLVAYIIGFDIDGYFLFKGHVCLISAVLLLIGSVINADINNGSVKNREITEGARIASIHTRFIALACAVLIVVFLSYFIASDKMLPNIQPNAETTSYITTLFSLFTKAKGMLLT